MPKSLNGEIRINENEHHRNPPFSLGHFSVILLDMPAILLTIFPFLAAFLGGYVVYRWKRDLHPWLSLSGGLLLGVALLDLLPESIEMAIENGWEVHIVGWMAVVSVLVFHAIDQLFGVHAHHEGVHEHEDEDSCHNHSHLRAKVWTRSFGMILHRFCDGLAIGGGFLLDPKIGFLIAAAMTLHGFADGMSIVAVLKTAMQTKRRLLLALLAFAVFAPILGSFFALVLPVSSFVLMGILAWLSGFFLFLSLSELLPQAHASKSARRSGLALTLLGVAIVGMAGIFH